MKYPFIPGALCTLLGIALAACDPFDPEQMRQQPGRSVAISPYWQSRSLRAAAVSISSFCVVSMLMSCGTLERPPKGLR